MSSHPAVAAPAAQVPLHHARKVYRCALFGTSQAWDIPDVLRGLRRNSGAFKTWYIAQFRLTRKSLAARGNIQACKSIKATKDRSRLYMKRRRDYQRVVAQQIALGGNASPWGHSLRRWSTKRTWNDSTAVAELFFFAERFFCGTGWGRE